MLGVLTLLRSAPIGLAMAHQAMALVVLTAATLHACRALAPRQTNPLAHRWKEADARDAA
jgi:cytochrome c oxidase assembly protein subunit 15